MEFWFVVLAFLVLGLMVAYWVASFVFWVIAQFKKMRRRHEQRLREAQMERVRWGSPKFETRDEEHKGDSFE
jgi:hypothetical protein